MDGYARKDHARRPLQLFDPVFAAITLVLGALLYAALVAPAFAAVAAPRW